MSAIDVAVIGDRFMASRYFVAAIERHCGDRVRCHCLDMDWPDRDMEHGYATPGMQGLKEYQGEPDEVIAHIGAATALVTHLAPMSADMFARVPQLRWIGVSRGGPVNIDMAAARAAEVTVVNTPGRNASAVAEFTLGAILAETRNITRGHDALRRGEYRGDLYRADVAGDELCDLEIGLIGYGEVGRRVTSLLLAFDARVMVCDPYVQLSREHLDAGVRQVGFDELLGRADVISLHPRVTAETTGMIGADALARMKPGATLINTARGPLLDYDALYQALVSGHLRGAMLETFDKEPPDPDNPLLQLPNVTLTPHIAGASMRTVYRAADMIGLELQRWLDDQPPNNPC